LRCLSPYLPALRTRSFASCTLWCHRTTPPFPYTTLFRSAVLQAVTSASAMALGTIPGAIVVSTRRRARAMGATRPRSANKLRNGRSGEARTEDLKATEHGTTFWHRRGPRTRESGNHRGTRARPRFRRGERAPIRCGSTTAPASRDHRPGPPPLGALPQRRPPRGHHLGGS